MTAKAETTDVKTGFAMGAKAYIRKPFEPEELLAAVTQCLISEKDG